MPPPIHIASLEKLLNNFHTVQPGVLYRSAQLSPHVLETMIKKHNIKTIINLRGCNEHKRWWQKEKKLIEKLGVTFYNIRMSAAHLPDKQTLLNLLQLYQHAQRPILIHCYSGADRTGEAAALWVLEQQKKNKKTALNQLALKYGHLRFRYPAKQFFIKLWQGKQWLIHDYDPQYYAQFN
jgi:protein tyrosine/serine phosphatase